MSTLVLDHLWQSTLVLAVIGLLTLFFRNNGAHVRHALWTVASLKFLLPFALLNGWGVAIAHGLGLQLPGFAAIETLYATGQPFSDGPVFRAMPIPSLPVWFMLMAAWAASIAALLLFWLSRWRNLRAALRAARVADIAAPMPVRISPSQIEPGLVGIFRPVLLLPEGIRERLTAAELQAVIAHEACHLRRRDNFWAALHMLAEALFWFWPPVWWLGTRLIAERERACDEAVLAAGNRPEIYAESILKVCKHYVQSPLACAAGVAGANLTHRMETIMENRMIARLGAMKKVLLGVSAAALVLTPLAAGLLWSPGAAAQGASACKPVSVAATHTPPPYPKKSWDAGQTGTVLLHVTIARNGRPSATKVIGSSGHERLDDAASDWVQDRYLWEPLNCSSAQTDVKAVFKLGPKERPGDRAGTFNQDVWIKNMENDGAKVERLGGNNFRVTLPQSPRP